MFYSKVSSGYLRQDSQSSNSFGKIQNFGFPEFSEEKIKCFIREKFHYFVFKYILYILYISYIYILTYILHILNKKYNYIVRKYQGTWDCSQKKLEQSM